MIRAFIAVELDPGLREALARVQAGIKTELSGALVNRRSTRVQWIGAESMHVTMKFLGEMDEAQIEPVFEAMRMVAGRHAVFSVPVRGVGVFPDLRAPRVLWAGLHDRGVPETLTVCAADLDAALGLLGFAPERRPFSAHLTLARIKDGGREVGRALQAIGVLASSPEIGMLQVDGIALMRSELRPGGPVYTRLHNAPLMRRAT